MRDTGAFKCPYAFKWGKKNYWYVVRPSDVITLFGVSCRDFQLDMTVAMMNANSPRPKGCGLRSYEISPGVAQFGAGRTELGRVHGRDLYDSQDHALRRCHLGRADDAVIRKLYRAFLPHLPETHGGSPGRGYCGGLFFRFLRLSALLAETRLIMPEMFRNSLELQIEQASRLPLQLALRQTTQVGDPRRKGIETLVTGPHRNGDACATLILFGNPAIHLLIDAQQHQKGRTDRNRSQFDCKTAASVEQLRQVLVILDRDWSCLVPNVCEPFNHCPMLRGFHSSRVHFPT